MNILIAHYPPYCSKWNPIEHKLFSHLHRAWEGAIFHDIQIVKELALETSTKTGLMVEVRINDKTYQTGREVDMNFKETWTSLSLSIKLSLNGIISLEKTKFDRLFFKVYEGSDYRERNVGGIASRRE